ncbi:ABC transporter permease subunit [Streptomyces sp. NPDC006617]|uniref:ABC transporter permease subunit n=1 Tax=Streptomyces sp. NPDC006617 TaxID=3155354 RepID=UPI0033B08F74
MTVSRRRFLALGAGAAAGGFGLGGCGSQRSLGDADEITLWTWDRSVSDELVARAETKGIPGAEGFRASRTNIGGHFNTKVRTALAGKSLVPDIIGINSDVATYFPNQDAFVECVTPEGRMIAFPMDTGPTGLFYRADLLREAGITIDPKELAARAPNWDGFIALGKELRKSRERTVICPNICHVWSIRLGQLSSRFMTEDGRYIGDRNELREAFEIAYRVGRDGLSAGVPEGSSDVFEAAKVDGAGNRQTFLRITIPMLRPVILFVAVTSTIGGLQLFTEPQVLFPVDDNGNVGGPGGEATTIVLYLYQQAFVFNRFGYGAAVGWALFLLIAVFSVINWRLIGGRDEDAIGTGKRKEKSRAR